LVPTPSALPNHIPGGGSKKNKKTPPPPQKQKKQKNRRAHKAFLFACVRMDPPQPVVVNNVEWNDAIEQLIKSLGEKALSLSWLHNRSEKQYSYYNNYLAIPTIVLSTITGVGTAGFGTDKNVNYAMAGISILVSVISTLNSYFLFAKRAEAHRITAISYSKLYLQISIELSLPRKKRMNVKDFLKVVSEQIQRLNEIQPQVSDLVIKQYNEKFKDEPPTISKPEITNGLVEIKCFVEPTAPPPPEPPTVPELVLQEVPKPEPPKKTPFR
jgi:hypothetical protein